MTSKIKRLELDLPDAQLLRRRILRRLMLDQSLSKPRKSNKSIQNPKEKSTRNQIPIKIEREIAPHPWAYEEALSSRHYLTLKTRSWPPSATIQAMQGHHRTNPQETWLQEWITSNHAEIEENSIRSPYDGTDESPENEEEHGRRRRRGEVGEGLRMRALYIKRERVTGSAGGIGRRFVSQEMVTG